MNILHIVAGLWTTTGGPAEVIPNLCISLVKKGHNVTLLTVDGEHSAALLKAKTNGVEVVSFKNNRFRMIRYCSDMRSYLHKNIKSFDIVHNHGHWLYPNWIAYLESKKMNAKLVTTPHGTLVPGMLKYSKLKKFIAWNLLDKYLTQYASMIHCLSEEEKHLTTRKVDKNSAKRINVIPNGANEICFDIASKNSQAVKTSAKQVLGLNQHKKTLLYMSRVTPIKGITDLIEAWQKEDMGNWQLVVVGDWAEELNGFKESISNDSILIKGGVYGDGRFNYLAASDAFILPSYGEGLPTSLLEAGAAGLLVLCTRECNFDMLVNRKAGIIFETGILGVRKGLRQLQFLSETDFQRYVALSSAIVRDNFSWGVVSEAWIKAYSEITASD